MLGLFLFALYCSFRAVTSSSCPVKYEARLNASSSDVGAPTDISSLEFEENHTLFLSVVRATPSFKC